MRKIVVPVLAPVLAPVLVPILVLFCCSLSGVLAQEADLYHARKHFRRLMTARLSEKEIARLRERPWLVRLGNVAHRPFKEVRRRLVGRE